MAITELKLQLQLMRISQSELARRGQFSKAYVNRVINGKQKPSERFIEALCKTTGIDRENLFEDEKAKL